MEMRCSCCGSLLLIVIAPSYILKTILTSQNDTKILAGQAVFEFRYLLAVSGQYDFICTKSQPKGRMTMYNYERRKKKIDQNKQTNKHTHTHTPPHTHTHPPTHTPTHPPTHTPPT